MIQEGEGSLRWGEYPQTWPDSQGTSVVPTMTTAADVLFYC